MCKFEANSGLFNEDLRKFWPISAFPQQNHPKSDRLLATVAQVDVLVSWNFKHIVRLDKILLFNAINSEQGYKSLTIHSPREVISHDRE
uniref:PIN domain-containing protein n=1 Tax=Candidatus Kentrum sp. DK TaxID=2126562 RepID=A0A450SV54_9GAMM|nr:MAG: hypothetical protein BECKDK2373C_GA0170839_10497 [Candidatus Kentron sp. DK]VFJ57849.1 MAG: hypothetical protein BECKDK2373B_GA0170837_106841 [Candidatus Kentron sp. DK]